MRKRRIWQLVLLPVMMMALSACGKETLFSSSYATPSNHLPSSSSYVDLVVWDGITFYNSRKLVQKQMLGDKLGEVQFRVEGSGRDPYYQLKDGDATILDKGTVLYQVKDTKQIAAQTAEGFFLYEPMRRGNPAPVYKPIKDTLKDYTIV